MKRDMKCWKLCKEHIGFYGVMIFILFAMIFSASFPYIDKTFDSEECTALNDNWTYVDQNGTEKTVNLPIALEPNIKNGIRISRILPMESGSKVGTIGIFNAFQYITAYLGDEVVYSYQPEMRETPNYGKIDGSSWHVMRLPEQWNGKTLTLEITSPYEEYQGCVKEVFLGTKASFLFKIIERYGGVVLLSFGIIFSGILFIVIYCFTYKLLKDDKGIFYLGWFQIWVGLWIFSQSKMTQFFCSNEKIMQILSFVSLMMMPIPILLYLNNRKGVHFKRQLRIQIGVHIVEIVVVTLLHLLNRGDFYETLLYTHLILMITILLIISISVYEKFVCKNKEIDLILFFGLVLGICGILELIFFYEVNRFVLGRFIHIGIVICIIASAMKVMHQTHLVLKLSGEAQYYQKLATLDYMTGCQNKTAYLKELQRQNQTLSKNSQIAVVVSDLNHLKRINDELGHSVGDNTIRLCATMLLNHFGNMGTCYRIGGDEFVCLIYNQKEDTIKEKIEEIIRLCKNESKEWGYDYAIAMGYSIYIPDKDRELEVVVQRADEKMYAAKQKMKTME